MIYHLKQFAAAEGIHISLMAEPVTQLGPLVVTNAIVYGIVCAILLFIMLRIASNKITYRPQKSTFAGIIEFLTEFVIKLLQGPFGTRKKAAQFAPYFAIFFFFIIFNNIMGITPLVTPGATVGTDTPIFRPFTADLNATIAMSLFAILLVQYMSIREQGIKGHLKHYFSDKPLNPINMFIGLLEVFGEIPRMFSLAFRLFLNTAVGEILIAVFAGMIFAYSRTPLTTLPIVAFEILVAGIQAYVFTILAATYLGLSTQHADHGDDHDVHHAPDAPKTKVEPVAQT